jgi:arylsulfatase
LLLGDGKANPRNEFYYYYGKDLKAVRLGSWKLHLPHSDRTYEGLEPGRDGLPGLTGTANVGFALYDLEKDIGERNNVFEQFPGVIAQLMALAEKARQDLGDSDRRGAGQRTP